MQSSALFLASLALLALPSNAEVALSAVLDPNSPVSWGAPCLIEADTGFYSFATQNKYGNIPVAYSKDFDSWDLVMDGPGKYMDAMPEVPPWANSANPAIWAPDVNLLNNGSYIMYFTAVSAKLGVHCIGAAYSNNITGPYTSLADPWYCPVPPDEAIDPDGFFDPSTGKRYVTFKWNQASVTENNPSDPTLKGRTDSPCGGQGPPWSPTPIVLQEVDQDGITLIGGNTTLVDNDGASDQGNTESPSLMRNPQGNYVLFFSTGCFLDSSYTVSYAVSTDGIDGPYTRHPTPLFDTGEYDLVGPGTLDVLDTGLYTVFFSQNPANVQPQSVRKMRTALIDVLDTNVLANGTLPGVDLSSPSKTSSSSMGKSTGTHTHTRTHTQTPTHTQTLTQPHTSASTGTNTATASGTAPNSPAQQPNAAGQTSAPNLLYLIHAGFLMAFLALNY